MSLVFTSSVQGLKQIRNAMEKANKDYRRALGAALYEEGLAIMAESVKETPEDTGRLKQTACVSPPDVNVEPVVELGYDTKYAPYVHEIPATHDTGKAFFLRDPLRRAQSGYTRRIQKRTARNLSSGRVFGSGEFPPRPKGGKGK